MNILNTRQHLQQDIARYHFRKLLPNILFEIGDVRSFEVHDEEILLVVQVVSADELMDLENTLYALQFLEKLVFLEQNAFCLVWLFHFYGYVFVLFYVVSLVNGRKAASSEFLAYFETVDGCVALFCL